MTRACSGPGKGRGFNFNFNSLFGTFPLSARLEPVRRPLVTALACQLHWCCKEVDTRPDLHDKYELVNFQLVEPASESPSKV
jgi:hypothetical protein